MHNVPEWAWWWLSGSGFVAFGYILRWLSRRVTLIKGPASPGGASETRVQSEWNKKFPYDET